METFTAEIQLFGKTATGLMVPPEAVAALDHGKRPPVVVRVNDFEYRSTIAPYGDEFFLPVNRKNRERAGVSAGDVVDVEIRFDDQPRTIVPPADLAVALASSAAAEARFEALSYSHRREYVEWIEDAKKPETRARRIRKAIEMLTEGKTQR